MFCFHLITGGAPSRLHLFSSFALRNYLFRIPNIFEKNFNDKHHTNVISLFLFHLRPSFFFKRVFAISLQNTLSIPTSIYSIFKTEIVIFKTKLVGKVESGLYNDMNFKVLFINFKEKNVVYWCKNVGYNRRICIFSVIKCSLNQKSATLVKIF